MSGPDLNLASRPFVNSRPVYRIAIVLWVLGTALLAANVLLYWRHFVGKGERQDALAGLEESIAEETATLDDLERRLEELDLDSQNQEIEFLNQKIEDRTFPWSAFFDRLAEVLPATVRLQRISPRASLGGGRARRARQRSRGAETVGLSLAGTAESGEDLLALVDAFFDHPSFLAPNLSSEARREDSRIDFSLTVLYLDRAMEAGGEAGQAAAEAGEVPPEQPGDEVPEEPVTAPERSG